jgi:hypothetical protein
MSGKHYHTGTCYTCWIGSVYFRPETMEYVCNRCGARTSMGLVAKTVLLPRLLRLAFLLCVVSAIAYMIFR